MAYEDLPLLKFYFLLGVTLDGTSQVCVVPDLLVISMWIAYLLIGYELVHHRGFFPVLCLWMLRTIATMKAKVQPWW